MKTIMSSYLSRSPSKQFMRETGTFVFKEQTLNPHRIYCIKLIFSALGELGDGSTLSELGFQGCCVFCNSFLDS